VADGLPMPEGVESAVREGKPEALAAVVREAAGEGVPVLEPWGEREARGEEEMEGLGEGEALLPALPLPRPLLLTKGVAVRLRCAEAVAFLAVEEMEGLEEVEGLRLPPSRVADARLLALGSAVPVGEAEALLDARALPLPRGEAVALAEVVALALALSVGRAEVVPLPPPEAVAAAERLGEAEEERERSGDLLAEGEFCPGGEGVGSAAVGEEEKDGGTLLALGLPTLGDTECEEEWVAGLLGVPREALLRGVALPGLPLAVAAAEPLGSRGEGEGVKDALALSEREPLALRDAAGEAEALGEALPPPPELTV
jgi:hypothetical protein